MNRRGSRKFIAASVAVIALLSYNFAYAKDYSVTAGNWEVNFKSNETLYTEINEESNFISVLVNEDPVLTSKSGIIQLFKFDDPTPYGKEALKGWMSLYISSMNKSPIMSDYTIDNTDAVLAEGWDSTLGRTIFAALYPIDINSYGSAQKVVGFLSSLDRETNIEIVDSLHVEYAESPQATQTPATNAANNPKMKSDGNIYSYDFETLGLDFSTPLENPIVDDSKYTSFIRINLADDVSMTGEIEEMYSSEDSSSTASTAESLWDASYYDDHSPLTTSRLDNGDYVVYGRYLSGQSMNTKALRTIDLNNDGQIDYYIVWDGSEKIDQDLITYIAMHSGVRTLKPKWD